MTLTTCGDYGGRTAAGEPCERPRTDGRCPDHTPKAREQKGEVCKKLLELHRSHPEKSLEWVCSEVGISSSTLRRWREEDEAFDAELSRLRELVDRRRVAEVEDTLYGKIIDGEATPAEIFFWLTNRAPSRWKHTRHLDVSARVEHDSPPEIPLSALRAARQYLDENERQSLSSPWEESFEEELPENIPSPWGDRGEPPSGNGDHASS